MKLESLTLQDLEKVKVFTKEHIKASLILLVLMISFALLCYFTNEKGSFSDNWGFYWFFLLGFPILLFTFTYRLYQLINEKNKLVGIAKIINKTDYNDSPYILKFDNRKLKKVRVTEDIYTQFQIGDSIYIEITHKTGEVLKIHKTVV